MPTSYDQTAFAKKVLAAIAVPISTGNINFLLAWFKREGTKAAYNPLATTLNYGSNTQFNKVGVKNYADENTGVMATAKTLLSSRYSGIVKDLRADNATAAANNHPDEFKTWSGGGYDHLVVAGQTIGGTVTNSSSTYAPGSTATAPKLPANATPEQTEAYIRENYPQAAGYLDVPEVRQVLIDAAKADAAGDPWTDAKLQAKIQATNWWRTTPESSRNYLYLKNTDPAQAKAVLQAKMAELHPELAQLGLEGDLAATAEAALKYGWSNEQLHENLTAHLQEAHAGKGLAAGSSAALTAQQLAGIARNEYFVPMTTYDAEQWAVDIYSGKKTEDQYRDYLATLAEARFPGLKAQGITPGQYLAPIKNIIADTLELQPGDVNLLDRQYSQVLQIPGEGRAMTLSEAQQWARSQKAYQYTKGARDEAASFGEFVGQKFGVVA